MSCLSLNSWDEWVGVDRLLKYTEENIQKQQANNKKYGVEKNTRVGRGSQVKPKSSNGMILHLAYFSLWSILQVLDAPSCTYKGSLTFVLLFFNIDHHSRFY